MTDTTKFILILIILALLILTGCYWLARQLDAKPDYATYFPVGSQSAPAPVEPPCSTARENMKVENSGVSCTSNSYDTRTQDEKEDNARKFRPEGLVRFINIKYWL